MATNANSDVWIVAFPLHKAACEGDVRAVEAQLSLGKNVNEIDTDSWAPLHYAAWYGHADAVKALLGAGADVTVVNESGATPLHLAAGVGQAGIVELLLQHPGTNVNARNKEKQRPVDLAKDLKMGDWEKVVQLFVDFKQ